MSSYYAVTKGRSLGIFNTWEECSVQVNEFKGAQFKKFPTYKEAYQYLNANCLLPKDAHYAYIDGSCKGNIASYGLVFVKNDEIVIKDFGKITGSKSSVMGELTASMRAVELAIANCFPEITIVYDYNGVKNFVDGTFRAKKEPIKSYKDFMLKYSSYVKINFVKCKGHGGIKYHKIADELAKIALYI